MAEKEKTHDKKEQKKPQTQKEVEKKDPRKEEFNEVLIRVYGNDIPGSRNIYTALTRIKGISWTISNAICNKLNLDKTKRLSQFSKDEIKRIEEFIANIEIPDYLKNRRSDPETGETSHFYGTDLDMKKDFDIKRLKKIKSYKGVRHQHKLPVRGQRTRSHFRTKGRSTGILKKKAPAAAAPGPK